MDEYPGIVMSIWSMGKAEFLEVDGIACIYNYITYKIDNVPVKEHPDDMSMYIPQIRSLLDIYSKHIQEGCDSWSLVLHILRTLQYVGVK